MTTGLEQVQVRCRSRLLSDNGPCYVSKDLQAYLDSKGMSHTRGAPYHPQTQGKIERYHRTMKNVVKLQNYYQKEELERELEKFVDYYNNERVHESLDNVTPADVYCDRHHEILTARQLLKMQTLRRRRCYNQGYELKEEELIRPSLIRECVY
jgi:putative transposase